LAPVTPFQAALLLGDPATVSVLGQKEPARLSAGEYASVPRAVLPGSWDGLPESPPRVVPAEGPICAVAGGVVVGAGVSGAGVSGAGVSGAGVSGAGVSGAGGADEVRVPAGRGAVIEAMPAPSAPSGVLYLVTDLGVRHPVPDAEVLAVLGYRGVAPVRVPAEIVALLPIGPALYPQAARTVLSG
jgi:hypothetical protein